MCFKSARHYCGLKPAGLHHSPKSGTKVTNNCCGERMKNSNLYLAAAVICVTTYANGIPGDFVHDDVTAVVRNPDVQGTNAIWMTFFNDFWGKCIRDPMSHKSYRPFTILTFRFERYILGWSSPVSCHLINVVIHTAVTLLFIKVLRVCAGLTKYQAFISGLLFAVHPIHTEAVTAIIGRADLLAALFFLLSFYIYHRLIEKPKIEDKLACLYCVTLVAGVLCKETSLSVVGVCSSWDAYLFIKSFRRSKTPGKIVAFCKRISYLVLTSCIILLLRLLLMKESPYFSNQDNPVSYHESFMTRSLTFLYLPALNTWLMILPWQLCHDWQLGSVTPIHTLDDSRNLATAAFYLVILCLLVKSLRAQNREGVSLFWALSIFTISFLPSSNLFFRVGFVLAERILYIPSLGFCAVCGIGLSKVFPEKESISQNRKPEVGRTILFILLILFFARTFKRNCDWLSKETLLRSGLRISPNNAKMHYNYANTAKDKEDHSTAIFFYRQAVRLWPEYPSAHNNLGVVFLEEGDAQRAEVHFRAALKYQPDHIHAITNLAMLLKKTERRKEAINLLRSSCHWHNMRASLPYHNDSEDIVRIGIVLASLYAEEGLVRKEEEVYLKLLAEFPSSVEVQVSYADFLSTIQRWSEASKYYQSALSIQPDHVRGLISYAGLMNKETRHAEANNLYRRALDMIWDEDVAVVLTRTLIQDGNLDEAEQIILKLLHRQSSNIRGNIYLAQVRLQQSRFEASEQILRQILRSDPHHKQALYHLSLLLLKTNRSQESITAASSAAEGCFIPREFCACIHSHLADLLHMEAFLDSAVKSYRTALDLEPSLVKAHLNLGAIYHLQGNFSNALEHYSEALTYEPTNSLLLENIGKLHRIYGHIPESLLQRL